MKLGDLDSNGVCCSFLYFLTLPSLEKLQVAQYELCVSKPYIQKARNFHYCSRGAHLQMGIHDFLIILPLLRGLNN